MKQSNYFNRTRLLNLFTEKKFSAHTRHEIALCFKDVPPNHKEALAEQLYTTICDTETETDAITSAQKTANIYPPEAT